MHQFIFGQFNFQNEEIDDSMYSYDHGDMEFQIFGKRVHLDPNLVSRATKIPRRGGGNVKLLENPHARKYSNG